jgi:hypothetical protein
MNATWIKRNEKTVTAGIVLLALVHGLLYVHIVPPWQHYDEPTHFEYAWMIVDTGELPEPDVYDWEFRADLVRSLIEHDFYAGLPVPDPENLDRLPAGLQYPQLDDPPLYYLLASVPIRLAGSADLAGQVIAARYVSLLLLGATVFAVWGMVAEITPGGSRYRIFVPLTAAMLPGFVDLMTAVNNDVGAVAVFSFFLWGALRLIQRGPHPVNVLWVFLAVAAAAFTKSTAYLAVPLAVAALVLGILPGAFRRFAWIALGAGALVLGIFLLYRGEPAYWYRATSQPGAVRVALEGAPHGEYAMALDPSAEVTPRWLQAINQPLTLTDVARLRGRTLTFGFWMWFDAADPALTRYDARSPAVNVDVTSGDDFSASHPLAISRTPQFFAFTVDVPAETVRLWVSMSRQGGQPVEALTLYYDGFVIAEGSHPADIVPNLAEGGYASGDWAGAPITNLVRNPSAERSWPALRPWADNIAARLLPSNVRLSILMYTLFDRDGASWYYLEAGKNIFETFWGRFGWGHVPLPGGAWFYRAFTWITVLAVFGVVFYPFGKSGKIPVDALLFLGLALILVWFAAIARGAIFIFVEHVFLPSARYAFPAIGPTLLVLVAGWTAAGMYIQRIVRFPRFYYVAVYTGLLVVLAVVALWTIGRYYSGV